jgi:hypothetical protein
MPADRGLNLVSVHSVLVDCHEEERALYPRTPLTFANNTSRRVFLAVRDHGIEMNRRIFMDDNGEILHISNSLTVGPHNCYPKSSFALASGGPSGVGAKWPNYEVETL